jgi:hypothetical protein
MIILLLVIALVLVFGIGTLLEAAFWSLLIVAVVVAALVFLGGRALAR